MSAAIFSATRETSAVIAAGIEFKVLPVMFSSVYFDVGICMYIDIISTFYISSGNSWQIFLYIMHVYQENFY